MNSLNKILMGLLGLQVVLLLGMTLGGSEDRLALAEAVEILPGLEAAKVTTVEIFGPSQDGDAQERVKLARKGDDWVLPEKDDFTVKGQEVEGLLSKVASLRSRNRVLTGPTYHEKLEVSDEAYRRKIVLSSGGEEKTLFVGTSPRFKNVHVRAAGEDAVYQVGELSESDAGSRAWNWVDRTYVKVAKDELWSIALENEHGKIQLDKDPTSGAWAVLGMKKPVDDTKVDGLVADVGDIGLEAPVGRSPPDGADLGQVATVTVVTGTSTIAGTPPPTTETLTIQIGQKVGDSDRRYVKASSSEYVAEVAEWELKKLIETKRADLAQEEKKDEDK